MPRKPPRGPKTTEWRVKRLISIGAFWKNDRPDGIGFMIHSDTIGETSMQNLHDSLRLALEAYRKHADPAYIPVYLKQLEDVATARKQGHSIDYRVMAVTITNIEYLTEIGVIKSDSWNGVVYQYEL